MLKRWIYSSTGGSDNFEVGDEFGEGLAEDA